MSQFSASSPKSARVLLAPRIRASAAACLSVTYSPAQRHEQKEVYFLLACSEMALEEKLLEIWMFIPPLREVKWDFRGTLTYMYRVTPIRVPRRPPQSRAFRVSGRRYSSNFCPALRQGSCVRDLPQMPLREGTSELLGFSCFRSCSLFSFGAKIKKQA